MSVRPGFGQAGGQQYPVLRSIQKFLEQMAEGRARAAPTVLKELLQNADDAGATEMHIVLDEREAPGSMDRKWERLFAPAILVRNNAPFRVPGECGSDMDDFNAICDVASGHKRAQATAAGRFGIGFNSVYFLTDTPILFSRREVHVFDLLHSIFEDNGWRFSLDEFPAAAESDAGPLKAVLDWSFPKAALGPTSFGVLAGNLQSDYKQATFRLPLRRTDPGSHAIYADRYRNPEDRLRVFDELIDEGARAIVFMKSVARIWFGVLSADGLESRALVEATPSPPQFEEFLRQITGADLTAPNGSKLDCVFDRTVALRSYGPERAESVRTWPFHVMHTARYDDPELVRLAQRLRRNGERAVPWATLAIPLSRDACLIDGKSPAQWRVFLPLLEEGPSACLFSGQLFVGPSRQRIEYRLNESDEGSRRTEWNRALIERALIPMLRDVSAELPDLAPSLLAEHPKDYLSLFPIADEQADAQPENLTAYVKQQFRNGPWLLRLVDVWNQSFDLLVGERDRELILEWIPEWLHAYRDRFRGLATTDRHFIPFRLGQALADRLGSKSGVILRREVAVDVALEILRGEVAPALQDIERLLRVVVRVDREPSHLEGTWAFATAEDSAPLRYSTKQTYVTHDPDRESGLLSAVRAIGLPMEGVEWVRADTGLLKILEDIRPPLPNVHLPVEDAALELLRHFPANNPHDRVKLPQALAPFVDLLVERPDLRLPPDARLGFLVSTANQKHDRRRLGVILLKPEKLTANDESFWEVWFRRVFAEVDPPFARGVERLLKARPDALNSLHAVGCQVVLGCAREAFRILHVARLAAHDVYDQLYDEMKWTAGDRPEAARRVSGGLLDTVDAAWDDLSPEEKYTALALPIHRKPDGSYVALVPAQGTDAASLRERYRLQSDDDIEDAPIALATYQLLQTANARVRTFYRRRLELRQHGRVEVLKDVLRQIGSSPGPANLRMLRYLRTYLDDTCRQLADSVDDSDETDLRELRDLRTTARTVLCLDGEWHRAAVCFAARRVVKALEEQRWPKESISPLIRQLFPSVNVAEISSDTRDDTPGFEMLRELDIEDIARQAIASESQGLSLDKRAKLVHDNGRNLRAAAVQRAEVLLNAPIPTISGTTPLSRAVLLDNDLGLPVAVLRVLAPTVVDLPRAAAQLRLPTEATSEVLGLLSVPTINAGYLLDQLVARFPEVWRSAESKDRLQILTQVAATDLVERLRSTARDLEVVMDSNDRPTWRTPLGMVAPSIAAQQPPFISADALPNAPAGAAGVGRLWDAWCGVGTFTDVLDRVLKSAAASKAPLPRVAAELYAWLERVWHKADEAELTAALRTRAWVLAELGESKEFRKPEDVLDHPGSALLRMRFWVLAAPLPEAARKSAKALGVLSTPPETVESLRRLGECLSHAGSIDDRVAFHAYSLAADLLEHSESLRREWTAFASAHSVYRLFRTDDRPATSLQLFIGDDAHLDDVSPHLRCLRASASLPRGVIGVYERLGVARSPTLSHVLHALSSIEVRDTGARATHDRLVRLLEVLGEGEGATREIAASWEGLRVLTCAGTYEPLSTCLWDDDLGKKGRVASPGGARLADASTPSTLRLIAWLQQRGVEARHALRSVATLEVLDAPPPVEGDPALENFLWPWREWAREVQRDGSTQRDALSRTGLVPPKTEIRFSAIRQLRVRSRLDTGELIEQAATWEGPLAAASTAGTVLVRIAPSTTPTIGSTDAVAIDRAVAREIAFLLGGRTFYAQVDSAVVAMLATIERPSAVLQRLFETNLKHALHQYHDQHADLEFANLFDEYRRTVEGSKGAQELEAKMRVLLEQRFVIGRRELIRGYGYDEHSVFAELVQNAEDAYAQKSALAMDLPETCESVFRYVRDEEGCITLEFEHLGRQFNYWQHGARRDISYSRDVEGVLRSAGSFKPQSGQPGIEQRPTATIGRFGLGFKSVYLLTDRPEIHSGPWHFKIVAGCLPKETSPVKDLARDATRIRLPLRADAEQGESGTRLTGLLPFLRWITRLRLELPGAEQVVACASAVPQPGGHVEHVTLTHSDGKSGGRVLRCRSANHEGQLALLLGEDGSPRRWDEAFESDLFAALPLKARLGCGIAVSHRFEVQSGRTHLLSAAANARPQQEVAALLPDLVAGLLASVGAGNVTHVLSRFWGLWRWDRGDTECDDLRREFARALCQLAQSAKVVPTLAALHPTTLGENPLFTITELPDAFRNALIAEKFTVSTPGRTPVALSEDNVVADGFTAAYRRACEAAGVPMATSLVPVGWAEISAACRNAPWLADRPNLVSVLATTLNEDQRRRAAAWIALCHVRVEADRGRRDLACPDELLVPDFPGHALLPARLIRVVHSAYDEEAVKLLIESGLRPSPQSDDITSWVRTSKLSAPECISVLRYLGEGERFHQHSELAPLFRSPWFASGEKRLSIRDAFVAGLIPDDVVGNDVFKTWLGLSGTPDPVVLPPSAPPIDPRQVLDRLHTWWTENGPKQARLYEARLYPGGKLPVIAGEFNARSRDQRREWLSLLLLGALHTMGRTQPAQHREFVERCGRRGWLDVFADDAQNAGDWMRVLDEYLDDPTGNHEYHHWMKQFVSIYQVSRWLQEYVESFLNVNRMRSPFSLDAILVPRANSAYSGGGPDAPPLTRTLGIGASFVLRELVRLRRISQPLAHRHCYVPSKRVRDLVAAIGCTEIVAASTLDYSSTIHGFLVRHLGEERATFGLAFDLPLLALAEDGDLQRSLLGCALTTDVESASGYDAGWRTLPDGRRINRRW